MPEAATIDRAAPCPKCKADMVLAAVTPHSVATQLARHTYLCGACNQTHTYILPVDPSAFSESERATSSDSGTSQVDDQAGDRRRAAREVLAAPATLYGKDGSFLLSCTIRDLSKTGARLELSEGTSLPQYFLVSLLPDGSGRRLCSKVWQLALIAGVRFVERGTI